MTRQSRMTVTELDEFLRKPPSGVSVTSRRVRAEPESGLLLVDPRDAVAASVDFQSSLGRCGEALRGVRGRRQPAGQAQAGARSGLGHLVGGGRELPGGDGPERDLGHVGGQQPAQRRQDGSQTWVDGRLLHPEVPLGRSLGLSALVGTQQEEVQAPTDLKEESLYFFKFFLHKDHFSPKTFQTR
ncbi:uncharacterized protein LOC133550763 isoform X2 [Nerophis ophidion]|uniref:uncharacterized protein LOC133550763 isoform X2 n=1 Tax=Nerophis ophidion TaxID=159077 RepID=UPI002ADFC5C2|nr:uncharacterized protein LOC133550763 isoform X2 [Nerophis ophidion]